MPATSDSSTKKRTLRRNEYMTPTEVADRLLVTPVTVRMWAQRGLLPSETTPGGHRRFRTRDVEEFVARRRQEQSVQSGAVSLLIIDDDAQYTRYLQALLRARAPALQVETAPDGFSAGLKCESLRPDIVTLDLQMPEMNGIEVCRLLRAKFGAQRPRIVVLSGYLSEQSIAEAMAAGANSCIPKSASPEILLRELGQEFAQQQRLA